AVEARFVDLFPDLDEVAIGPGHQSFEHFHDVDPRAQSGIDRAQLEADDSAADHEHALGDAPKLQRAGGVDDARVLRQERQLHRLAAGGDDRLLEADLPFSNGERVRIDELSLTGDDLDLAAARHR